MEFILKLCNSVFSRGVKRRGDLLYVSQNSTQCSFFSPQASPKSSTFSHQNFVDISTELLSLGYSVRFRARGYSMFPIIKHNELMTVEPAAPYDLKKGDIVLYRLGRGVIAHRVIRLERRKKNEPSFILRGDASTASDYPVKVKQILGRVISVQRAGRNIDPYNRKARILSFIYAWVYRLKKWIMRFFPLNFQKEKSGENREKIVKNKDLTPGVIQ